MTTAPVTSYAFGPFQLDASARQLFRDGKVVPLAPKTAELLVLLVRDHGRLVTKETILDTIWPGLFIEDTNLAQHVSRLRKALGSARYIETVTRRGYRFVGDVRENATPARHARVPNRRPRHIAGRARELGELRAMFDAVTAGQGRMILVTGEPGIGKTAVVEEFLSALEPVWIVRGRCSERLAGAEAHLPFIEALDDLRRSSATAEHTLESVAPGWYDRQAHAGSADQRKRELLLLFRELVRTQPLILFLEDVHWAGISTVELLAYLGASLDALPVLIILTARMEEMRQSRHPFVAVQQELQARRVCRELPLPFLTREDIAEYLAFEFGRHELPGSLVAQLHATTEGNPLFMVDLVQSLRLRGVIAQSDGVWRLTDRSPDLTGVLPESVRAMIERKIGQLSDAERQLLVAASVQGVQFDVAVLADGSAATEAEVEERLDVLEREFAFVQRAGEREFPDGTPTERYQFVHGLYQNALYRSLAPARRVELSRRIAGALLRFFGARSAEIASELAILFETARDSVRAAGFYARAAENALSVFAYHDVEKLARRGLALLSRIPDRAEAADHELDLLSALSVSLMATRGFSADEVRETCLRVRTLGAERGETRHVIPAIYGLFSWHEVRAEYEPSLHWAGELLRLAEQRGDRLLMLQGHACLCDALLWMGRFEESLHHAGNAIAIDDNLSRPRSASLSGFDPGIASRILRALALAYLGRNALAIAAGEEAVRDARALAEPPTIIFALFFDAVLHQHLRDPDACLARSDEVLALCRQHGLADWMAWATFWRGWARAVNDAPEEGIAAMLESLARQDALGSTINRSIMLAMLADAYGRQGDVARALETVEEAHRFAARTGERCYEHELQRLRATLSAQTPSGDG